MKKIHLYGNWKMNMNGSETAAFFKELVIEVASLKNVIGKNLEIGVFPPFTSLGLAHAAKEKEGLPITLGAQNVHFEAKGAFTGEISLAMVKDVGCTHVIIGHSERRHIFGESDETIAKKVKACLDMGVTPVLCYGETLAERESNRTFDVMGRQLRSALSPLPAESLKKIVYAYEPVWAIGTGKSATSAEAQEVCAWTKKLLAELAKAPFDSIVLYGGSVSAANSKELFAMEAIDGGLVGGASLKAGSFTDIYRAYAK